MTDQEFKDLKFKVNNLEAMIELLAKDIQDIKQALLGNEFGQDGLVKKVQNNEKQIDELLKFKQKIIAWATATGLGSSALFNAVTEIMK